MDQTITFFSPHVQSDITVSGTENTVVIPASVFRSSLHGSARSLSDLLEVEPSWGGLLKNEIKKKILSRSCGGMWSLSILSHFCCCQSQFSAWWNFIKLLRVLWEELLSTFIHILNKKGRYSKCLCQGLMHWNQTLEFKNAVDCMTWGSWRVTLNCKRQSALTKMHLFLVWVMSVFYLMWMLHPVKPDLRVKLVEHT